MAGPKRLESGFACAELPRILILVALRAPSASGFAALRATTKVIPRTRQHAALWVVELSGATLPDAAARAQLAAFNEEADERFGAAALAVAPGFISAMARAVVLGARMAARTRIPFEVADTVEQSTSFLRRVLGQDSMPRDSEIADALGAARRLAT